MIGQHDRQEAEADVQIAINYLRDVKKQYEQLGEHTAPHPGSVLHSERRHTAYTSIDTAVAELRARATDNLDQLFESMVDEENGLLLARPYAQYSMIRAVIESAATALWLIQSESKATRVLRCLQLSFRDANDRYSFSVLVRSRKKPGAVLSERERRDKVIKRLNELKDTVGQLKQRELGYPPKYTEILKSVSEAHRPKGEPATYDLTSPLVVWKVSSAFLHGNSHTVKALSDVRQLTEFTEGIAQFEVTPNLGLIAASIGTCVATLSQLDERYTYLARHDHAGRPVGAA
jgi:hypothetical protein